MMTLGTLMVTSRDSIVICRHNGMRHVPLSATAITYLRITDICNFGATLPLPRLVPYSYLLAMSLVQAHTLLSTHTSYFSCRNMRLKNMRHTWVSLTVVMVVTGIW